MRGVNEDTLIVDVDPDRLGVLLTLQPPKRSYIDDKVVLSCFRVAYEYVLKKIIDDRDVAIVDMYSLILMFLRHMETMDASYFYGY